MSHRDCSKCCRKGKRGKRGFTGLAGPAGLPAVPPEVEGLVARPFAVFSSENVDLQGPSLFFTGPELTWTIIYDASDGQWTGTLFTAAEDGVYVFFVSANATAVTVVPVRLQIELQVNAAGIGLVSPQFLTVTGFAQSVQKTETVQLTAGDTVTFQISKVPPIDGDLISFSDVAFSGYRVS